MSCVLPEDLIVEIISERLQVSLPSVSHKLSSPSSTCPYKPVQYFQKSRIDPQKKFEWVRYKKNDLIIDLVIF